MGGFYKVRVGGCLVGVSGVECKHTHAHQNTRAHALARYALANSRILITHTAHTPCAHTHTHRNHYAQAVERGCQFVLLGSAPDPKVQEEFDALSNELRHGQVRRGVLAE